MKVSFLFWIRTPNILLSFVHKPNFNVAVLQRSKLVNYCFSATSFGGILKDEYG